METYVWVLKVGLALFFLMPAIMKLKMPKAEMVDKGNITASQSVYFPRFIGLAELAGVLVMIASLWEKELQFLSGMAALGFALVMAGAFVVHFKKGEIKVLPLLAFVFAVAITTAFLSLRS